ncbi:MAG: 6-hydroxymethylpterin diphosphokinase MptE-like protein [Intestinibacter bartlettii]|uniref:6-hydroxymethylpterin diphosphokinase MptE-like protein n=1 Tax=Intestinibacter bartlettii TaxID=261299 RepID=UPI003999B586
MLKQKLGWYRYKLLKFISLIKFRKSNYADVLIGFKNKYEGQRCFIIGNGPSLNVNDLEKLKNEITFGFNRIYYIFNKTDWRPTFYCSEDLKIIQNSVKEINDLDIKDKFIPLIIKEDYGINIDSAIYFNQRYKPEKQIVPSFSENIVKKIDCGSTVTYTAIQIAAYMGFKEIYLIGVDHSFARYINEKGEIVEDKNLKDYFCEEYNKDKEKLDIPTTVVSTLAYQKAEEYSRQHGFRIYNATRGGKLEVFERVDFDKLFD